MQEYKANKTKRSKILNDLFKKSETYKRISIVYYILLVLSALILIGFAVLLINSGASGFAVIIFGLLTLLFAFIPFIIASAIKRNALIKATKPYGSRTFEKISFQDDGFWYTYLDDISDKTVPYRVARNIASEEYLHRYYVKYSDIQKLTVESGICKINGSITYYLPNVSEKRQKNGIQELKRFSFLMSFDDEINNKIIQLGGSYE